MFPNLEMAKSRKLLTDKTREFFDTNGFLEVETPIMNPIPGMEPHLSPFETKLILQNGQTTNLYLNTSPELQMKKLLGAGFGNIYNITKVFRNGEIGGGRHNPEFTMIEWYRYDSDYKKLMEDCENLTLHLAGKEKIEFNSKEIKLAKPWTRKTVNELFIEKCDIDLEKYKTYESLKEVAEKSGLSTEACNDWDEIFYKIFLNEIEPDLGTEKPIFVYDYPASQAALSKKKADNPFWAERFELYIGGMELSNAFSELIDPEEQKVRLQEEQDLRKKLNKTVFDIDGEFLEGLKSIQRPCAGIALGLDRLFMLLMNKQKIEDVLLFPLGNYIK